MAEDIKQKLEDIKSKIDELQQEQSKLFTAALELLKIPEWDDCNLPYQNSAYEFSDDYMFNDFGDLDRIIDNIRGDDE